MNTMTEDRPKTDDKPRPWLDANTIMVKWNFSHDLMWRSQVWAAKGQDCPTCLVGAGYPCHNMADINAGHTHVRTNRWPHSDRVDWDLLVRTLKAKGFE